MAAKHIREDEKRSSGNKREMAELIELSYWHNNQRLEVLKSEPVDDEGIVHLGAELKAPADTANEQPEGAPKSDEQPEPGVQQKQDLRSKPDERSPGDE